MTPNAAMNAIETRVATQWASGPNTPIAYPNVPFTPPATGNWLKLDFIFGQSAVLTKGPSGLNAVIGILQLAVFGPKDSADGTLDGDAEAARAIVNRVRFTAPNEDVMFSAVSGPVRQFEESWRSLIVSAPFQVIETVP